MEYGLIGKTLKHSYSKEIHESFHEYRYDLVEIAIEDLSAFLKKREFKGINVTIPYKEKVIPYLDFVSESALAIGAVNTIVNRNHLLYGYNTDYMGLDCLLKKNHCQVEDKTVAILGTGGTSLTSKAVCSSNHAKKIYRVSRNAKDEPGIISYDELQRIHSTIDVMINTTPWGMFPKNDEENENICLSDFENLQAVVDVIYNPLRTNFVLDGLQKKIASMGGLYMLVAQAVMSHNLFLNIVSNDTKDTYCIDAIYNQIKKKKENVVLIGMPSSGKSTLGIFLANQMNRPFYDIDSLIEKEINQPVVDIITQKGIAFFREAETKIIQRVSKETGCVLATGGGCIEKNENIKALKQNGVLYFLNRSLDLLTPTTSRPLSSSKEDLQKLYDIRLPIYMNSCDVVLDGDLDIEKLAERIKEDF